MGSRSPPRAWGRRRRHPRRAQPARLWGRPARGAAWIGTCRFTPTCVGTTAPELQSVDLLTVHPHVRGDDGSHHTYTPYRNGSPPRAWGRHRRKLSSYPATRFTPTCVGTTLVLPLRIAFTAVHPHVRGDDRLAQSGPDVLPGSPPRAWGRRSIAIGGTIPMRFTPTCVGTTGHAMTRRVTVSGSPPRAWGRLTLATGLVLGRRFTPTCVGTTSAPALERAGDGRRCR